MEIDIFSDEYFMREALKEAVSAYEEDEVPVGAIVVIRNKIIAKAHNSTELLHDVTAHAEILAITAASNHLGSKYLNKCTLYVTLEPCLMCAGALFWSQIGKVVYGARDEKRGYSLFAKHNALHPKTKVTSGIMQDECSELLSNFFKKKR
ncbi:MAG TPA: tRNA-specific adenosine deaminase [Flavobacteriales bacterium]|nr:tRNA-specific adenosine deaminase [Flavobacteriales bacterium]